jgi:Spy/CpxP family protein refolding chaperone
MNWIQSISIVIVASGLAVIPALAQNGFGPPQGRAGFGPPPGPGLPALERLDRQLGFNDAQAAEIQALLNAQRDALAKTIANLREAERALAAAVMQVPVDDGALQARVNDISAIQAQLTLARAQLESKIYQLLTADQQQKAQEWLAQMQQQTGRRGGGR